MSGFTLVDFSIPARELPKSHPHAEAPICSECQKLDLCFFNPSCDGCQDLLLDQTTSIPELFAVMRQWVPQTQRNIPSLTREILRRGANVNDRDGLTDLTILHYASKSGAAGVGNELSASNLVRSLLSKGAESAMRCKWTDMNALHYAVFFDSAEVVEALADHNPSLVMSLCSEFNNGNSLHIAASNISLNSAKVLIKFGADGSLKDRSGKLPFECIPENYDQEQREMCTELKDLLKHAADNPPKSIRTPSSRQSTQRAPTQSPAPPPHTPTPNRLHDTAVAPPRSPTARATGVPKSPAPSQQSTISTTSTRLTGTTTGDSSGSSRNHSPNQDELTLDKLGLKLGDRIIIDSSSSKPKVGTVRFGGSTEFQPGPWAGVELDTAIGKNNGSYAGVQYFSCKAKYGIFVPMHRISKAQNTPEKKRKKRSEVKRRDSLHTTNKAIEDQSKVKMKSELQVGDKVIVGGVRPGVLRFKGAVKFAPGFWLGVELDSPQGKNDGTVAGEKYFNSKPKHGVFVVPSKVKKYVSGSQTSLDLLKPEKASLPSSGAESTDYSSSGGASRGLTNTNSSSDASASPHAASSPSTLRRKGTPQNRGSPKAKGRSMKSQSGSSSLLKGHSSGSASPTPLSLASSSDPILEEGMSVLVSKELGVVRFIGETEFSPGLWLGVELRKPNGKNDGSVQGKRYFSCKSNHGLFVKPEKASHRGINCAKLIPALKTS